MTAVVALFLAAVLWVAVWVPFHATDSLIYGRWSRLIADTGDLHFDGVGSGFLHRPLVYVGEGWLWRVLGFSEPVGRLWMALFLVVLVAAVWRLAAIEGGAAVGALAGVLLVATPDVVALAASGLTDVPVAALHRAVRRGRPGRPAQRRAALRRLAVTAALAILAKPSALPAVAGLGARPARQAARRLEARLGRARRGRRRRARLGRVAGARDRHRLRLVPAGRGLGPRPGRRELLPAAQRPVARVVHPRRRLAGPLPAAPAPVRARLRRGTGAAGLDAPARRHRGGARRGRRRRAPAVRRRRRRRPVRHASRPR